MRWHTHTCNLSGSGCWSRRFTSSRPAWATWLRETLSQNKIKRAAQWLCACLALYEDPCSVPSTENEWINEQMNKWLLFFFNGLSHFNRYLMPRKQTEFWKDIMDCFLKCFTQKCQLGEWCHFHSISALCYLTCWFQDFFTLFGKGVPCGSSYELCGVSLVSPLNLYMGFREFSKAWRGTLYTRKLTQYAALSVSLAVHTKYG